MINEKKIIINVHEWDPNTRGYVYKCREFSVVLEEELERVKKQAKDMVSGELLENDVVYFDKSCTFPRRKFNNNYKNKVTNKADKATCIFVDIEELNKNINHIPIYTYFYDLLTKSYQFGKSANGGDEIRATYHGSRYPDLYKSKLDDYKGKKIVDVSFLDSSSGQILDDISYEKLDTMLSAKEDQMVNMGMNMLTSYSYSTEKYRLALLVNKNWENIKSRKKSNIEMKTMLTRLTRDFPQITIQNSNQLWFKIAVNGNEDSVIMKGFTNWVRKFYKDCPDIKIVKNEVEEY